MTKPTIVTNTIQQYSSYYEGCNTNKTIHLIKVLTLNQVFTVYMPLRTVLGLCCVTN